MNKEQLVSIPQEIADWIELNKTQVSLYGAMKHTDSNARVDAWMTSPVNQETFALAWINGYTIQKDKVYTVSIKSTDQQLYYNEKDEEYYFSQGHNIYMNEYHTKSELVNSGLGWVFDCIGMEIKEVEYEQE